MAEKLPTGVRLALRSDDPYRFLFERVAELQDIVADLVALVSRDKTIGEKLKTWLKDRKQKDDQELDDSLKQVLNS